MLSAMIPIPLQRSASKVPDIWSKLIVAPAGSKNGMTSKSALEEVRNKLVNNYVQQRDELLDASLPEVMIPNFKTV